MILCWSRWRRWWFTTSQDRHHTFEGIVGFLHAAGGVLGSHGLIGWARWALRRAAGSRCHHRALAFARHHGMAIQSCQADDAKRKGKVERPFRQLREGFLSEQDLDLPGQSASSTTARAPWRGWTAGPRGHARITCVPPAERLAVEQGLLPLPPVRFDTAYCESRQVIRRSPLILCLAM
jgi:hypothetical protein